MLPAARPWASCAVGLIYALGSALEAYLIVALCQLFTLELSLDVQLIKLAALLLARLMLAVLAHATVLWQSRIMQESLTRTLMDCAFESERVRQNPSSLMANQALTQLTCEGIPAIISFYTAYLPTFTHALCMIPVALIILWPYSSISAIIIACGMLLVPVAANASRSQQIKVHKAHLRAYEGVAAEFEESLKGLSTLKIFGKDDAEAQRLAQGSEGFRKATMRLLAGQLRSLIGSDGVIYTSIVLASICAALTAHILTLVVVAVIALRAFDPMRQFVYLAHSGAVASRKADAFQKVLNSTSAFEHIEQRITHAHASAFAVCLEEVSYTYPNNTAASLQHINLNLPQTGLISIMGPSGSGKSTLSALISGMLLGYEGKAHVLADDLAHLSIDELAQKLCVCSGTAAPLQGTVRASLDPASILQDDVCQRALDLVGLKLDLNFELTLQAANLSGGQRQRLLIARAICAQVKIYIFDEATSALDKSAEAQMWNIFKMLAQNALVIVITHRLANVHQSDRLICMNQGAIVQDGSASEVLSEGLAHKIYQAQQIFEERTS